VILTTNNCDSLTALHTPNYSPHKTSSAFTSRCLVAASNGGSFGTVPGLSYQLVTSLNCSSQVTQQTTVKSKSKLFYDGRSVSQSRLGVKHPSGAQDCRTVSGLLMCGALSDERMHLCRLQLLLAFVSAVVLGSESRGTHDRIASDSRLPQPGGPGPRIYIPPGTGWSSYNPTHWVPFSSPPTIWRATVEVFVPASTRKYRTHNISCIIARSLISGERACPQSCSLATAVVLSPVYTAVTWQRVYMSQYIVAFVLFRLPRILRSDFQNAACSVRVRACPRLISAWTVGRMLFTYGIQEFNHRRSGAW
jgi:hypothetical protein